MVYDARHALEHPEVAGWALGSLDPDDVPAFEQHLQTCEQCRGEVAEFTPVAESLALAAPAVEPPADLELKVVAAVQYAAMAESAAGNTAVTAKGAAEVVAASATAITSRAATCITETAVSASSTQTTAVTTAARVSAAGAIAAGNKTTTATTSSQATHCAQSTVTTAPERAAKSAAVATEGILSDAAATVRSTGDFSAQRCVVGEGYRIEQQLALIEDRPTHARAAAAAAASTALGDAADQHKTLQGQFPRARRCHPSRRTGIRIVSAHEKEPQPVRGGRDLQCDARAAAIDGDIARDRRQRIGAVPPVVR